MALDSDRLVWIDLEMTGLNPDQDVIIEIATIVTDKDLTILAHGPVIAVHQPDSILVEMDEWNQQHHSQSGLIDRVKASEIDTVEAERQTLEFLRQWLPDRTSPMCGNTIGQDRRFLFRYMPQLEAFFHYRSIDVSTLKELAARWAPEIKDGFTKVSAHRALDDVKESIDELQYYREHFIASRFTGKRG
ncbi:MULTISPECIES: oligoribonuclease [Methylomicrobium]|uniref:Oligoribonuclease n=1 Tax=Methylomicrobium album BG8 TaxID=686340 RepID=H8GPZ3_METAL|nr:MULTISPECIES: oligoribonuclease [Methylomicrobium]EIC29772.1 oligoribonuclease (3'->5' exoribonuclease) [Methylomicrobium album BG8]